ncbi:MAG: hypothetical protein N3G74_02510 [Candidatus Micrarchaeota archaeon]|nr:hypothetical protein [Candidatus Micrarchaeota archaeon]
MKDKYKVIKCVRHNFAGSIAKISRKKDDNKIMKRESDYSRKEYKILEKLISDKNYMGVVHLVESACEGGNPIKDSGFYLRALKEVAKQQPAERYYLSIESIAQSAAIAGVADENIYLEAINYILTQRFLDLAEYPILQPQNIESACRVLASIAITNEHASQDQKINASNTFKLALERVKNSIIAQEKRTEEKPNRMVEILEQAFAACSNPEICRDMYEEVYMYIKENPKLSEEYKIKTLAEITSKAIKTPGVSHTKLFNETIAYLKENNAGNLARSLAILLDINKK